MTKTMKFVAISLMALALFSCNKKDEPKKSTASVLSLRIDETTLRAFGDSQVASQGNTETLITKDVVLTLMPSGRKITLNDTQIGEAKSTDGTKIEVGEVVTAVSMTANGIIDNNTQINTLQKTEQGTPLSLSTEIPLVAESTNVGTPREEGVNTIYPVTLAPKPGVARVEVSGKIEPTPNETTGKNAFASIEVTNVYMNNYLATRAGDRTYIESNGSNDFQSAVDAMMMDEVTEKDAFEDRTKVAGYQLFPKKADEEVNPTAGYFDHIILKLKITYSDDAQANGFPATPQVRFVTIQRFMKSQSGDLESFEAGHIYKLNLGELSKDFKTDDNGTPNPDNPDTPDPEPKGKRLLEVKVTPYVWTVEDITPDMNDGYKK